LANFNKSGTQAKATKKCVADRKQAAVPIPIAVAALLEVMAVCGRNADDVYAITGGLSMTHDLDRSASRNCLRR
jgi:hypothetical protein